MYWSFTHLVKPVILYSSEVWGDGKCEILEKLPLRFCKYILAVNKSNCSNMVCGELGITPLDIDIKSRMIVYWAKLVSEDQSKISHMIYSLLYKMNEFNIFKSNWLSSIRCTLNDSGFPGMWLAQSLPCSVSTFRNILKIEGLVHTKKARKHIRQGYILTNLINMSVKLFSTVSIVFFPVDFKSARYHSRFCIFN